MPAAPCAPARVTWARARADAHAYAHGARAADPHSVEEMPTNNFVESSFWNFDTLFQPQQHPSRDAHDTFFLKGVWLACTAA